MQAKGEEILAKIQRAWKAAVGEFKDVHYYFRDRAPGRNYPPNSGDYIKRKIAQTDTLKQLS